MFNKFVPNFDIVLKLDQETNPIQIEKKKKKKRNR